MEIGTPEVYQPEMTAGSCLVCPITGRIPKDPVCIKGNIAHVFEREALIGHLQLGSSGSSRSSASASSDIRPAEITCPKTGTVVRNVEIIEIPRSIRNVLQGLAAVDSQDACALASQGKIIGEEIAGRASHREIGTMTAYTLKEIAVDYEVALALHDEPRIFQLCRTASQPQVVRHLRAWVKSLAKPVAEGLKPVGQIEHTDVIRSIARVLEERDWCPESAGAIEPLYSAANTLQIELLGEENRRLKSDLSRAQQEHQEVVREGRQVVQGLEGRLQESINARQAAEQRCQAQIADAQQKCNNRIGNLEKTTDKKIQQAENRALVKGAVAGAGAGLLTAVAIKAVLAKLAAKGAVLAFAAL